MRELLGSRCENRQGSLGSPVCRSDFTLLSAALVRAQAACFVMRDYNGQAFRYVDFRQRSSLQPEANALKF
jgi:hypothetical protein